MKPLPFFQTFAHPNDLLHNHLERVAMRTVDSIAPSAKHEVRLIAFLAGLFHDIGKGTPYFQEYLLKTKKRTKLTPHAKSSAVLSWWYTEAMELPLWVRLAVFIAILRHHGALNYNEWRQLLFNVRFDIKEDNSTLIKQLNSLDLEGIHGWLQNLAHLQIEKIELPATLKPLTLETITAAFKKPNGPQLRKAFSTLEEALMFIAGFGGLLAVDKIDTAIAGNTIHRQLLPRDAVHVYKSKNPEKFSLKTELDKHRENIAETVEKTWLAHLNDHLFSLTAPTGSGKTLTVLNAALAIRAEIDKNHGYSPRIIYCLPFTSVIEQNYAVFRAVFRENGLEDREDLLLKHHHLVSGLYRTEEQEKKVEHEPDGAGQLLTETWQSELVVTTFHQLLHSLLSKQNSNLKRAGQLTGSLVLMDEVQAIPIKYWQTLRVIFQSAARCLGTRFILLTATRPLIFRADKKDATELLPNHSEYFQALSRVQLHWHHQDKLTLNDFSQYLIEKHQSDMCPLLIIVNRIKSVNVLFNKLIKLKSDDRKIIALSTHFTPKDRRARICLIRRLLKKKQACIVITTQLIEAGVDVSFPVVHRELAPLDSVIQSSGRCNRNNDGVVGEVHLWQLYDTREDFSVNERKPLYQGVYDRLLIQATETVFGKQDLWQESDFLTLSQQYFTECWEREEQSDVDKWLKEGDFEAVEQHFELISQKYPKKSLFVVATSEDKKLWQTYRNIYSSDDPPLNKENAFRKIRKNFYERVIQVADKNSKPDPNEPITKIEAGEDSYTREIGFIKLKEKSVRIF
ncbi:CRISPR-associated helicase Cas3' [Candidatus Parabeggiatoa sp. HSG14]|uniref:CRISPR-associated helicase Cas3' n=1 Tax=Candidatus Parabeggiatoa sp. HSG14 TaxID=3055593 RepID=UPI0025A8F156|nr:CRISPR-associated helicase Cas3' [Thiotrichales bacterium HSG14]